MNKEIERLPSARVPQRISLRNRSGTALIKSMVALAFASILAVGCNMGSPDQPELPLDAEESTTIPHELQVDGITLIAEGETSRSKYWSESHRTIQIGEHMINLKDGELQINGRSYGQFFEGDEVEITRDGEVLVNGETIGSTPISNGISE
jgi:hypothetical protein